MIVTVICHGDKELLIFKHEKEHNMSELRVKVRKIDSIEPHPDSEVEKLELAKVSGYNCCVRKNAHSPGDLVIYIPEDSILPEPLIEELGLKGFLAGKQKNRVKAVRLRGVVSQGIVYSPPDHLGPLELGADVKDLLGIEKFVPQVPTSMTGKLEPNTQFSITFDIERGENLEPHEELNPDHHVIVTEKIHGTFLCAARNHQNEKWFASSKGASAKKLVFQDTEENASNLYLKMMKKHTPLLEEAYASIRDTYDQDLDIFVLAEIFGPGVQDLHYGFKEKQLRIFDIRMRTKEGTRVWMTSSEFKRLPESVRNAWVPIVYEGKLKDFDMTPEGPSVYSGIREGFVVKTDQQLGRKQMKLISKDYLTRKRGTEYN